MSDEPHSNEWYLAWKPGDTGVTRDDRILAVGLQCKEAQFPMRDVIQWLGPPDKVSGNPKAGYLAYFFDAQQDSAALFDVVDSIVTLFSTITRQEPNAMREVGPQKEKEAFNILDEMEEYDGSEMKNHQP